MVTGELNVKFCQLHVIRKFCHSVFTDVVHMLLGRYVYVKVSMDCE